MAVMKRTAVINVVGLAESLMGEQMPRIRDFRQSNAMAHIVPALPAVTCTAQTNYVTGFKPSRHGIVGNGWYNRELAEVHFWKQSNHLVRCRKLWDDLKRTHPNFTCAKLFWWFNMYSSADYSITPRPSYPADGRKIFDIYSWPYSIRAEIKKELGEFPFPTFWGPVAGVKTPQGEPDAASRWIAESAKWIEKRFQPTLNLVYLPHLDYNLQRFWPYVVGDDVRSLTFTSSGKSEPPHVGSSKINPKIVDDLHRIDSIVGDLISFFQSRDVQVVLLSEYGITPVDSAVHLNRVFRERGLLAVKEELGHELIDYGASRAFAVADHQVAHIYLKDRSNMKSVRALVAEQPGVDYVLTEVEIMNAGLNHIRAGDLIAVAKENAWFTYYYWLDDELAPDFARTVDIHRKPGYDPVELFLDPKIPAVKLKIARRLLQKKLGFRMLMDVIPLDASLVKGSHGCRPKNRADWPVLLGPKNIVPKEILESTEVYGVLRTAVTN